MQDPFLSFKKQLRNLREGGEPEVHERVDLRAWTSIGIGGQADILVRCRSADGVQRVLDLLAAHGLPWLNMGAGSRLVPPDRGLRVPVINLSGNLGLWELELDGVVAGAGANLAQVSRAAARAGLSGLEQFTSVSSSLGGAIEAATTGQLPIVGFLDWVDTASPGSPIKRFRPRSSDKRDGMLRIDLERRVVLRARFDLVGDDLSAIHERIDNETSGRIRRQPRSAAPFFADSRSEDAVLAIEAAGCQGASVGGARLSESDSNRLCVSRTARAEDVIGLCRLVAQRVEKTGGGVLEPAMRFVDEEGKVFVP